MPKVPFGAECYLCGDLAVEVHHVDYDDQNNAPENLRYLCQRCHTKVTQIGYIPADELESLRAAVASRGPERFERRHGPGGQEALF